MMLILAYTIGGAPNRYTLMRHIREGAAWKTRTSMLSLNEQRASYAGRVIGLYSKPTQHTPPCTTLSAAPRATSSRLPRPAFRAPTFLCAAPCIQLHALLLFLDVHLELSKPRSRRRMDRRRYLASLQAAA